MLRDLRARGLKPWRCSIADGHLGLWAALAAQQPAAAEQRCWHHRITTVLDAMAKKTPGWGSHPALCHALCGEPSPVRGAADASYPALRPTSPKAVERFADDWERLVTFYQFPREHGCHLRTTNVESTFAAVRLRTTAAKRFKKVDFATALIWKLPQVAEGTFRRLNAPELLPGVYVGVRYVDGVKQRSTATAQEVAA